MVFQLHYITELHFFLLLIFSYVTYLIQLTDLSVSEATDAMKIRVSDQSGAVLDFLHNEFTKVFTSYPHAVVTA